MDVSTSAIDTDRSISRRTVLSGIGAVGLASIAGCSGTGGNGSGSESVPDPITIDDEKVCDNCSMKIGNYKGPAGQSHYEDPTAVEELDEDRPAQFCSSLCTYTFAFKHESKPQVSYLTDYSTVDYEVDESTTQTTISRHLEADAFGDVTELTMVAGSDVIGAMGDSIVPFSDADQADEFQAEYGGDIYEHDEITQELVSSMMSGGM
ncbi:nitrous oxide reductase accessory protein NosL [Haloterrigena sp. H1]|uniref:nitrous oxide reductase accessory protein NosL n=1 Tax=Haloterrigena sp. H1 TaxID=2552943 RepID=UPI00110D36B6|nr:nitrous oxide reductase accessory protein NosL [Haloterrigena sp. H1]TMT85648.1 nitrous oxide reductase accessory protein NosL [Haloterrigena sp. H1]